MCFKQFNTQDKLPRFSSKIIKRPDKFERPFKSLFWAAGFSFSYGSIIKDSGYHVNIHEGDSTSLSIDDVFFGEEII